MSRDNAVITTVLIKAGIRDAFSDVYSERKQGRFQYGTPFIKI